MEIYNNVPIQVAQSVYDAYNHFMYSNDRNVFNKLYSKFKFYEMTKDLCGDIVECGVFKGSGLLAWLKILELNEPNSLKKVIGFDFFGEDFIKDLENEVDKKTMTQVFTRCNAGEDDVSMETMAKIIEKESGFGKGRFELIKGDLSRTSESYVSERPGFRISLLNLDVDLEKPTYDALENFWDRIVEGGVILFDEYAYHKWSESNAADLFVKGKKIKIRSTKMVAPSAYIIKE